MAAWHESTRTAALAACPALDPGTTACIGIGMRRRHHSTAGCQQRARAASLATASQQPSRVQGDGDTDGILVLSPDRDIQLEIRDEVVATMRMVRSFLSRIGSRSKAR